MEFFYGEVDPFSHRLQQGKMFFIEKTCRKSVNWTECQNLYTKIFL